MSERRTREQPIEAPAGLLSHHGKLVYESPEGTCEVPVVVPTFHVGSAPENDLVLDDEYVSGRHVVCERGSRGGYRIRDLDSRNGTFVNGQWTREAALPFGSTLRLGRTELRFLPVEEHLALEPSEERSFGKLVAESVSMRRIFALLERIGPSEATVLFGGETGTGKELAAQAVHETSARRDGPFVVVDCSSLPDNLAESELFGHEKGAFTGAERQRVGAFERANGGTVFLDEVGELPLDRQSLLLRVLEARQFRRVGGDEYLAADFRLLAATNRDLQAEVSKGGFREDLFYRLAVFQVRLPPLAQRLEDLGILCRSLLGYGGEAPAVAPEALDILRSYKWPGNVRELRNVLDRAKVLSRGQTIEPKHLMIAGPPARETEQGDAWSVPANLPLHEIEKRAIERTLKANDGNLGATAQALEIARSTLYEKLRRYEIKR